MLLQPFNNILNDLNVIKKDNKIVIAVSGGVDSVVLLHLLMRINDTTRPSLVIAHINHNLRAESAEEEKFVKKLADTYHIPFHLYAWPKAQQPKNGIEEAARNIRYHFFRKVMDDTGANLLMTGHHQDDQVETILMKLTRGSSLQQLTGIELHQPFHKGELIRPLLFFPKEQIYDYAHHHGLKYAEDASNQELTYSRNRFRNEIIPRFKEENAQFNEHIEKFSRDLDDLLEIAEGPIQKVFHELTTSDGNKISFNHHAFLKLTKAMQRALLHTILFELYRKSEEGYKTNYITLIQDWIMHGEVNTELDLTENRRVKKGYEKILFYIYEETETLTQEKKTHVLGQLDEWLQVSDSEKFRLVESNKEKDWPEDAQDLLIMNRNELSLPLTIRHRRPGDRMTYHGLNGSKKIKDIFIDEKVPPEEREKAWIVEDSKGNILWLVNYRKMRLFTPQETDKLSYILEYKKD
jgi:tRNA(Ile)-lysidine synthase/bifunctional protein TilS/HprT